MNGRHANLADCNDAVSGLCPVPTMINSDVKVTSDPIRHHQDQSTSCSCAVMFRLPSCGGGQRWHCSRPSWRCGRHNMLPPASARKAAPPHNASNWPPASRRYGNCPLASRFQEYYETSHSIIFRACKQHIYMIFSLLITSEYRSINQ